MHKAEPLYEPSCIVPVYIDNLAAIIPVGPVTHLLFAVRQPSGSGECSLERALQARLIVPTDQLKEIGRALMAGRLEAATTVNQNGDPIALH